MDMLANELVRDLMILGDKIDYTIARAIIKTFNKWLENNGTAITIKKYKDEEGKLILENGTNKEDQYGNNFCAIALDITSMAGNPKDGKVPFLDNVLDENAIASRMKDIEEKNELKKRIKELEDQLLKRRGN